MHTIPKPFIAANNINPAQVACASELNILSCNIWKYKGKIFELF